MTYLGMQVLVEGLALAAFGFHPHHRTRSPWPRRLNAYVMQDEARHVMFGRLAFPHYYPELTQKDRDEREEFRIEACYRIRDRFLGEEVWERLELPKEIAEYVEHANRSGSFAATCSCALCRSSKTSACSARDPKGVR